MEQKVVIKYTKTENQEYYSVAYTDYFLGYGKPGGRSIEEWSRTTWRKEFSPISTLELNSALMDYVLYNRSNRFVIGSHRIFFARMCYMIRERLLFLPTELVSVIMGFLDY